MRILDYIENLSQRFAALGLAYGHGTDNPYDEACYLVLGSLGLGFDCTDEELGRELTAEQLARLEDRTRLRAEQHVPVAYLVGEAWFAGLRFKCDGRALVPRSPIAELILDEFQPLLRAPPGSILDLCAGGGCIGIACAMVFPDALVDLVDISPPALELARENIALHGVQARVRAVRSDLFAALGDRRYDLIVCNPPYVGQEEFSGLPAEYHHEPELGLLTERGGLDIPQRILARASDHLEERGLLVMEVGNSQHLLAERFPQVPFLWLEFEHGGEGVFALTAIQLREYRHLFI